MQLFDAHTHLNSDEFYHDIPTYLKHAADLGVVAMANVGSDTTLNARAIQLAHEYDNMVAVVGFHPEEAASYTPATKAVLRQQLADPAVVALGEIGLDYHEEAPSKETQQAVFQDQIELAKAVNKPIMVHNRDAFADVYAILKQTGLPQAGGIMHSFNGDPKWLAAFLELGMTMSYSGVASFKNTHEVHAAVKATPLDRFLVETDAPYLTPEPFRGRQNEPAYTRFTVEAIARLRHTTPEEIAQATMMTTRRVFQLD